MIGKLLRVFTIAVLLLGAVVPVVEAGNKKKAKQTKPAPVPVTQPVPEQASEGGLELWQDPVFREQFLHSFRPNSEIEPSVTTIERDQLEKVLPLLGSDPEAARAELETLTTPESSAVFDFTLGNLYFQERRLEEAAARYRDAVEKFPSFRRAHKNLGLIHVRRGEFEEAIRSLSRVIQLGGEEGLVYGLLGYAYSSTEQYIAAESAYRQALLLQPELLEWKLGLTQVVLKQQKYGETIALCNELITQFPDRADYWMLQANAYIGLNQPMRAAQNFEMVYRMDQATAPSMNTLGDIYVNEKMLDLATRAYGRALELDPPRNIDPALSRVEALAQRGALRQAKKLLTQIENLGPILLDDEKKKRVLKLRSRIAVAEGTGDESVDVLEQIVTLDPLDGEALILLGQHYARVDEPDRAIFYYERASSLEEFEADANIRHAQLLVGMARYPDAVPLLKRAQEIEPREDVARYLDQVERLARTRH